MTIYKIKLLFAFALLHMFEFSIQIKFIVDTVDFYLFLCYINYSNSHDIVQIKLVDRILKTSINLCNNAYRQIQHTFFRIYQAGNFQNYNQGKKNTNDFYKHRIQTFYSDLKLVNVKDKKWSGSKVLNFESLFILLLQLEMLIHMPIGYSLIKTVFMI